MKDQTKLEPLFFKPVYKHVIWGGNNISRIFKRNISDDDIGESWELSAHPSGLCEIENSSFEEKNLLELFNNKKYRKIIFGNNCVKLKKFPILIKFIDATKNLSIQVHPDDEYAKKHEDDSGKSELWYIMECKKGAKIIHGFKDTVTCENLKDAINNIEENVNKLTVHEGDLISIPSGVIHAIMDGIVLCEVQQSSDITYRVYDWNRLDKNGKPRELHTKKALDVIKLDIKDQKPFNVDIINIDDELNETSNKDSFYAYVVLEGKGSIKIDNYTRTIEKGTTFLIPATLGNYILIGNMKLMKVYM